MRLCTSLFAVVPLLVGACTPKTESTTDSAKMSMSAPADPAAVRQAIDSANAKAMTAMQSGDTATMMANYADDVVLMFPGAPMQSGKPAVSKFAGEFFAANTVKNAKSTTSDVMVSGDLAVESGTFEWTIVPKNGKPMTDKGKYITVWKKQADGSWKVVRDISNSDAAPK